MAGTGPLLPGLFLPDPFPSRAPERRASRDVVRARRAGRRTASVSGTRGGAAGPRLLGSPAPTGGGGAASARRARVPAGSQVAHLPEHRLRGEGRERALVWAGAPVSCVSIDHQPGSVPRDTVADVSGGRGPRNGWDRDGVYALGLHMDSM